MTEPRRWQTEADRLAYASVECGDPTGWFEQLYAAGEAPTASMSGTLRNLQNDFGLTPVAQGKVKSSGDGDNKGNAFSGNGRKQGAK